MVEVKKVLLYLNHEEHKRWRIQTINEGLSMTDLVRRAMQEYFEHREVESHVPHLR